MRMETYMKGSGWKITKMAKELYGLVRNIYSAWYWLFCELHSCTSCCGGRVSV